MGKTIYIMQSNYIPWKGLFDALDQADVYVIYDQVQYTKQDWRNRNLIKTAHGLQWLTIPVKHKSLDQPIESITEANRIWRKKHLKAIALNYAKAPHFEEIYQLIEPLYQIETELLTDINVTFLKAISNYLGIEIEMIRVSNWDLPEDRTKRLVHICHELKGERYLSGPAAKNYLEPRLFEEAAIDLEFISYKGYPEYPQLFEGFEHGVSIIDLLMNTGPKAIDYIRNKERS